MVAQYCGWHWYGTANNAVVKYAFIGNPARCPSSLSCSVQATGPNGASGADGMANLIAHELSEAVSDPQVIVGAVSAARLRA